MRFSFASYCTSSVFCYTPKCVDGALSVLEYEITTAHRISSPGNLTKGNDLEVDWRDDGETN